VTLQLDRAGLEPLEIEDVVDERDQADRVDRPSCVTGR